MKRLAKAVRRVYRGEKGFTLIELLVVIGILAVLAGVVTLGVTQFIGKGAQEAWKTEQHNVQTAVAAFQAENDGACAGGSVTAGVIAGDDISPYLLTTCRWDWTWGVDGIVTGTPP